MRRILLALPILLGFTFTLQAEVKLPSIFSDNAVLQADKKIPVWGWAKPGEVVTVSIGNTKASDDANGDGRWQVELGPFSAKKSVTIQVSGKNNKLTIKNVLIGEVWLCSGQSNMAWTVSKSNNFEKEKAEAKYPQIRMFKVANNPKPTPQDQVNGSWIVCSPETVGGFTASGYFFGRKIHKALNVPVGLINSSVGGTAVEAWTSMDVQANDPKLKSMFSPWRKMEAAYNEADAKAKYEQALAKWKEKAVGARKAGKRPPRRPRAPVQPTLDRNYPSNLFNGMINPIVGYSIRGAIWYQGERNARTVETATLYRYQLPLMIKDWRTRWNQGEFPFFWVQLPNFKKRSDDPSAVTSWAVMRESMADALRVSNSGMAITIDVGEAGNIHPKNKQDVGKRLAHLALARVYEKDVADSGPLYESHQVVDNQVEVTFKYAHGGLKSKTDVLKGFAIQDKDGKWHWAKAKIDGNKVIVEHPMVKEPQGVRYAFGDNPEATLYNGAGIPAGPFRTDR